MKTQLSTSRNLAVAAGFTIFIAASLALAFVLRDVPTPAQACEKKCSAVGKSGFLVYSVSATPKSQYKEANSECQCR